MFSILDIFFSVNACVSMYRYVFSYMGDDSFYKI